MMTLEKAQSIVGTKELSTTKKMPGLSFGLPAQACKLGSKLHDVPNTVCRTCYAWNRGNYGRNPVKEAQYRRLRGLAHPEWVEAMVYMIQQESQQYFRWHDSGDLQSIQHLENIAEIARRLPKIRFWLPTREYGLVRAWNDQGGVCPRNLTIRLSAHIVNGPLPMALADKLKLQTSGVHTKHLPLPIGVKECKAYTRGNQCGSCRLCWNKNVPAISYPKH